MPCFGNRDDHCCYLGKFSSNLDSSCKYVEENTVPGRRWSCGLYNRYASWDSVLSSKEYQEDVQPFHDHHGTISCEAWPEECNAVCVICGAGK